MDESFNQKPKYCPYCGKLIDSIAYDPDYKCDIYVHSGAKEACFQKPGKAAETISL